jgi:predicted transcriptional regulator
MPLPVVDHVDFHFLAGGLQMEDKESLVDMAADIVSAYVSANQVPPQELPALIRTVYGALREVSGGGVITREASQEPAIPVKKSITPDYIICLEDGKKFKSLKRHLRTRYGMTPEEYRTKWGLPHDYPMVAPNYAKERSNLAKRMGLGQAKRAD